MEKSAAFQFSAATGCAARVESLRSEATRELASRLKAAGLLLADSSFQEFLRRQKSLGRDLDRQLIVPIFSPLDHALLTGKNTGGLFASRPEFRVSLIAAFGYEVGFSLHSILSVGEPGRDSVARLCALFNLGISLFDRVCDRGGAAFSRLAAVVDEAALKRLMTEEGTLWPTTGEESGHSELSALLALIAAFFRHLRAAATQRRVEAGSTRRLNQLLTQAYRAEMATVSRGPAMRNDEIAQAAHLKSALPFEIMLAVAQLYGQSEAAADLQRAASYARHIGAVFSLSDDLSDLTLDFKSENANSILIEAGMASSRDAVPAAAAFTRLTAALQEAVEKLLLHLSAALRLVECIDSTSDRHRCRNMLLGYTRSWTGVARADR